MKKVMTCLVFAIGFSFITKAQYISNSTTRTTSTLTHDGNLRIGVSYDATSRSRNVLNIGDGDYVKIGEWEADDELSFKAKRFRFTGANNMSFPVDFNISFGPTNEGANRLRIGCNGLHSYIDYKENLYFRADVNSNSALALYGNGSVGIGFATGYVAGHNMTQGYKLAVYGGIICQEVKVVAGLPWSDFVFADDYELKSLQDVESFIKKNKHLPDVPSEKEVNDKGVNLGEMDAILLQKIEERTLYLIEQNKRIDALEKENKMLKSK